MFDVGLVWSRSPDGVEVHDYGPPHKVVDEGKSFGLLNSDFAPKSGRYFQFRSDRRVPHLLNAVNLEDPLVLRFVNADCVEALAAFFHENGMLDVYNKVKVEGAEEGQKKHRDVVDNINAIGAGERAQRVNTLLKNIDLNAELDYSGPKQTSRMVFYAKSLLHFMSVELAVAVMREVSVVRCAHCGNAFFTGQAAHRRIDAKTCSDRCRSAVRRRNAIASV